ncbi:septum formation family protein [Nocardioides sp. B-3]|uniref:septum formation family protein n=1 Tax=Nocardioides sp. B-3 TaxID=2895565 RepID=UPI00215271EB|nr:septum formation family protein [Nocardioides sp. B-3]UUZ58538.1 septum formation family protein [Nocardioides sp. B-3]
MRAVVALVLALALIGCSDSPPTAPTPSRSPSPSTAAPTTESVAVPRPEKNGCHLLSYDRAVAPVVGGTDVSCKKKHTSQTYKIGRLSPVSGGHLVAVDSPSVQASVASTCTSLLRDHVGGSPEDLRLSMVQAVWFTPSVEDAAAGADWFRCDVVALATTGRLAALPRSTRGLVGSSSRFAMCGTAPPDAASFKRVPCSAKHSWVAASSVDLPGKAYPSASAAGELMESACRAAARARADDPLDFTSVRGTPVQGPSGRPASATGSAGCRHEDRRARAGRLGGVPRHPTSGAGRCPGLLRHPARRRRAGA